jgi:hypothetical protein
MATVLTKLRKVDETASTDNVSGHGMDGQKKPVLGLGWHVWPTVCLLLCGSGTSVSARPVTNDYHVIVDRNLFGLRPVPPAPGPEPATPPKITLTGITTILGDKEVLMKVQVPSKPPQPPKDESLILSEGQRKDGIQVLAINLKTDDVTIDDFGTVVTLNLEKAPNSTRRGRYPSAHPLANPLPTDGGPVVSCCRPPLTPFGFQPHLPLPRLGRKCAPD